MIVYVGSHDLWQHQPLHLAILRRLLEEGFVGATVTPGIAGYGAGSVIKTVQVEIAVDLPIVVTGVDTPERVEALVPEITAMLAGGLLTVEDVDIRYCAGLFKVGFPDRWVADVMSRDPEATTPEAPLAEVVSRLVQRDYTALPVVDADGRVVGVIDEADLLDKGLTELSLSLHKVIGAPLVAEYLARLAAQGTTVRAAMRQAVTARENLSLRQAAHVMHARKLKRLPVPVAPVS